MHPALLRGRALRAVVARAHDGREDEAVFAVVRGQQLGVAQLDGDVVARQDVGDVHLEDVGPLLLQQYAGLAFLLRCLVLDAGLLLLADARDDQPLADAHVHRMHSGLRRAGEHVARFDRVLAFVAVVLRDRHVGDHAGDVHVDARGLQRQPIGAGIVARDGEVRALGRQRLGIVGVAGRADHHQERGQHRQRDAPQHAADVGQGPHGIAEEGHDGFSCESPKRCAGWAPSAKRVGSAAALV